MAINLGIASAAEVMRRILVENARRKQRPIQGELLGRVDFDDHPEISDDRNDNLLALDELLGALAAVELEVAEVIQLHYFADLAIKEVAQALQLSTRTVNRHWAYGRACFISDWNDRPPKDLHFAWHNIPVAVALSSESFSHLRVRLACRAISQA